MVTGEVLTRVRQQMAVVGAGSPASLCNGNKFPLSVALTDSQDTEEKQIVTIIFLLKQLQSEYKLRLFRDYQLS